MNSGSRPFQGYAEFYDQMYKQKDYKSECDFIEQSINRFLSKNPKSILDLGCGTGNHAIPLANRGYVLHGVDFSKEMLIQAKEKALKNSTAGHLNWTEGDITEVQIGEKFDVVICMFAVISYLTTNQKLSSFFKNVRNHLKEGGLFICDFWYGPAVLRDPPTKNEKDLITDRGVTKKSASSEIDYNSHIVRVDYKLTHTKSESVVSESHYMRYLFLPELSLFAENHGMQLVHSCNCCELDSSPSEKSWTVSAIFKG